jgi:tetratricopeptide (TPR) repeat protein
MPSVAFCLLAGWFLARQLPAWLKEGADRPYILGGALALIITGAFGWITVKRVPDWKDALSLNTSALRNSPNSARSHTFYAIALYENVFLKSKDQAEKVRLLDTMEYHLNEAIKIYPNYGSAWVMIPAMAGARFDMDRQMDKLFNTFDATLDKIPNNANFRSYLDQYMKYLATRGGNPNKIAAFCYRNGYERFYLKMKDYPSAIQILEYALLLQTEDERVLKALTEVYQAAGNQAKAAEMKARADAASRTGYSNSPDYQ